MLNKTNKEMKKVRAAIVGYGNIGHYVLEALQAAPDFEIAGVVRRAGAENKPAELNDYAVVKDIKELQGIDVAILCTPTRSVESYAKEILALGINTVDSFDIHTGITALRRELGACAKEHGAVSIISAGWDPGSHRRGESRPLNDYSDWNRYPPAHGIHRTERRLQFQRSSCSH